MSDKKKSKPEQGPEKVNVPIMTCYKKVLKHICTFNNMVSEMKVEFSVEEGIIIKAVDPAHVWMRELHIKPGPCLRVWMDLEIGLDLEKLSPLIALMPVDEEIEVRYKDGGKKLTLAYGNHSPGIAAADMTGYVAHKMPHMNLPGCYMVDLETLLDSIKHIEPLSDRLELVSDAGGLEVRGCNEKDDYTGKYPRSCVDFNPKESARENKSVFGVNYIYDSLMAFKKMKFGTVWLQLGDDYPGVLEVEESDGDYQFHDRILLAPRIENAQR